jgi:hypothetical protein
MDRAASPEDDLDPAGVKGRLRFSIRSIDSAGNRSKPSSAMLLVR